MSQLYTGPRRFPKAETPNPLSNAAVEAEARALCGRMGLDPDEVRELWDDVHLQIYNGPLWHDFRRQAREAIAMRLAIEEVMG